jgi:hypothetical protein
MSVKLLLVGDTNVGRPDPIPRLRRRYRSFEMRISGSVI